MTNNPNRIGSSLARPVLTTDSHGRRFRARITVERVTIELEPISERPPRQRHDSGVHRFASGLHTADEPSSVRATMPLELEQTVGGSWKLNRVS